MNKVKIVSLCIFVLLGFAISFETDCGYSWWQPKWMAILSGLVFYLTIELMQRTHWSVGPAFLYIFLNGFLRFADTCRFSTKLGAEFILNWSISYSCLCMALFAIILCHMSQKEFSAVLKSLSAAILINSLVVIGQFSFGYKVHGFLGEPSMNGCLMAVMLPIIYRYFRTWLLVFPVVAVVMTQSTTAIALLCLAAFMLTASNLRSHKIVISVFLVALLVGVAYLTQGSALYSPGNRLDYQYRLMTEWYNSGQIWLGYGLGSFFGLGPSVQISIKMTEYWMHLHSDLLRLVFENGVIGLVITALPVFYAIKRSWNDTCLRACLACVLAFACIQYPLTLAVHGFTCVLIFIYAIKKSPNAERV